MTEPPAPGTPARPEPIARQTTEQHTRPAGAKLIAGRYVLVSEIGRGGMGIVWHATDQVIGREVAIKELRLGGADAASDGTSEATSDAAVFTERVMREVRAGGRLNDPAVVTVYDVLAESGATYIVMELVAAPTLAQLVRQHGPLAPEQTAALGEQVLAALQAAHQAGVVHRDVKPGNILVLDGGRVKLTDFGIAQAIDDPRLTTSGMLVGSPAFMSPERVGGADASPASDMWALGATLYFAVEGTIAFERSTTAATLHAIMNEVPYLTRCGGPLASVISGLMIAAPEARLTAQQARGLLRLATSEPTPPRGIPNPTAVYGGRPMNAQPSGPQPAPRSSSRRRLLIGAALVAVLGLVGGGFVGRWLATPSAPAGTMAATLTFGEGGQLPTFSFSDRSDGNCFGGELAEGRQINDSSVIECDELHDFEIFSSATTLDAPGSGADEPNADYPSADVLSRYAESWCGMVFASNHVSDTGGDKDGALTYRALVPTERSWRAKSSDDSETGSRTPYCAVYRTDGQQYKGSVLAEVD